MILAMCLYVCEGKGDGVGLVSEWKCLNVKLLLQTLDRRIVEIVCVCVSLCEHRKGAEGSWFSADLWDQGSWR